MPIGIDIGTGGVRGCLIDGCGEILAETERAIEPRYRTVPDIIANSVKSVLTSLAPHASTVRAEHIAIAGTSGSMVSVGPKGEARCKISLYSDRPPEEARQRLGELPLPPGASLDVVARLDDLVLRPDTERIAFEADFVAGILACRAVPTDFNSALKAGCNVLTGQWPETLHRACLPAVVEPGTPLCRMDQETSIELGFTEAPLIVSGTTDGCAAALAAGLEEVGDAVTSLGSTLVLKVLSDRPVFSREHGIYSHRILGNWLAGGASNTGGAVLSRLFGDAALKDLSEVPIAKCPSVRKYVPLLCSGERFPVVDPYLQPNFEPRPDSDTEFFLAVIDSLVRWEKRGYTALSAVGAPTIQRLFAVGGGTRNRAWIASRCRDLLVSHIAVPVRSTAYGAAILAKRATSFRKSDRT